MKGELVGLIDSDDYIALDMFEALYRIMKDNDADLSVCDLIYVDEDGNILDKRVGPPLQNHVLSREQALRGLVDGSLACFGSSVKLHKAKIFNNIRFPEGLILEDNIAAHRIIGESNKVVTTDKMLYFYVQHEGSILANVRSSRFHELHFKSVIALCMDRYNYLRSIGMNELAEFSFVWLYGLIVNMLKEANYFQVRNKINKYIVPTAIHLWRSGNRKNRLRIVKLFLVIFRSLFKPFVKE